ncbi:putative cytochrome P450 oxidoreductase [Aspergillus bombycis]|uniref:Putative cytochrome P450 oxidoreductase n=1 Tax=Aspergillus bombycis TaxID=109264 RepID=A0A1F7ZPE9_9EURO|nr:putative cytochrome P450 oxidoreductase [Aspergillus bombycis]OGM40935.1 putative cytochrome P450 oxidoreductase [Aspergillus bombycis]
MFLRSLSVLPALAGLSGVSVHHLLYRHGEWDLKGVDMAIFYIVLTLGLVALQYSSILPATEVLQRPNWALDIVKYHILGVYTSMLLYRAAFHRLNRFPGPFLARLSNFYVTSLAAKKLRLFEETEKLHKKHGDYVRIGPTELSIRDPAAVKPIYGSSAKVSKGVWYTCSEPRLSLETVRDKKVHAMQRKVWDHGFSLQALEDYEPRLSYYATQLLNAIDSRLGQSMNMTQWFTYCSFDVMGDLAFGKGFNMLAEAKDQYFLTQLRGNMKAIGLTSHLSWIFPFFKRIPGLNVEYLKNIQWLGEQVDMRINNPPDRPDIFSWVLHGYEKGPKTKQDYANLTCDAELICVAGSDTTSATMTNMFFHLAKDHALYKTLQAELDALKDLTQESLKGVKLLEAVINETLRLHPAVPSGLQRLTPPEGLQINDTYIPGDVTVCIPMHTLFRDERVFAQPTEFIPERWTTRSELVKDPSAFFPFGGGSYVCAGKQLAFMEIRRVLAEILTRYNITFAPDHSDDAFLDDTVDAFTVVPGPLKLIFQRR